MFQDEYIEIIQKAIDEMTEAGLQEGFVTDEVAAKTGRSVKTVRRALNRLKKDGVIIPTYVSRETLRGVRPVQGYIVVKPNPSADDIRKELGLEE